MERGGTDTPPDETVSLAEAAARLKIPRGWVLRLHQLGRLPVRMSQVGRRWRVERAGLERWLEQRARARRPDEP
jgi:excisionase family DNA binding protein